MNYLPLVAFLVIVVLLLSFSARARRRNADAEAKRVANIGVGSEVMTTSGLYGTVVAMYGDDTVLLSIAPGVEVKWAFAALREMSTLPAQYRKSADEAGDGVSDTSVRRPGEGVRLDKPAGSDPAP